MKIVMTIVMLFFGAMASTAQAQGTLETSIPPPGVMKAAEKSPWAMDMFLHADHFQKNSRLNEQNLGLGIKYYHPDTLFNWGGEFFAEVGGLRNSQKGQAYFVGGGYTKKLWETTGGIRVSGSLAPTYINYQTGGRSASKGTILPFLSVGYGAWDVNTVYFPKHDGGFLLFSLQYRF